MLQKQERNIGSLASPTCNGRYKILVLNNIKLVLCAQAVPERAFVALEAASAPRLMDRAASSAGLTASSSAPGSSASGRINHQIHVLYVREARFMALHRASLASSPSLACRLLCRSSMHAWT